jgi:hypothetical protein
MGFGRPVWHVSVAYRGHVLVPHLLDKLCIATLEGVGDATRGEWREMPRRSFHLLRRLSEAEQERIGPAVDIRGTEEAAQRRMLTLAALPMDIWPLVAAE